MDALTSSSWTAWSAATLLLSVRLGAALLMTPVFSQASIPVTVRVLLVLGLAGALSLGVSERAGATGSSSFLFLAEHPGALIQAVCTELALGATLAVAIHLAFAAFSVAGNLLDIQIGFGLAQVFDPAFNAASPILTTAFNQVAVLVFFLVNGHHAILRAVAYSLERFPLGMAWPLGSALLPVVKQVGGLLGLAFALAAPIVFCILLAELALGVLARNLPQMNMLTMGVPIKIVIGLIALSLWLSGIGAVMDRVYRSIYATWDAAMASDANLAPRGMR
ncbi:flagellar biosynthetic protein FliR [Variovorax sp. RB2P76]|uniref:flagellar biosynthetic protein FliR n=1 Tax=Variovorax sp. RB2P76 TaxID=3443736 RepID=UPI003F445BFA